MKDRKDYRIVFFGTPEFAVPSLEALIEAGYDVPAVVTAVDSQAGRGRKIQFSDVKNTALKYELDILQPSNLKNPEFIEKLRSYEADAFVVVAFRMLPESVWNMPPHGTINIHGSLLPKYRGAAPIHWAVIQGEEITGVTAFRLQHQIDTGGILRQAILNISSTDTTGVVYLKLMKLGAENIVITMDALRSGDAEEIPQDDTQASHAPKIYKEDAYIDFDNDAWAVYNFIRGMSPFPCAWTRIDGKVFKIYFAKYHDSEHLSTPGEIEVEGAEMRIYCRYGYVTPTEVQIEGKKKMTTSDFLKGYRNLPNMVN